MSTLSGLVSDAIERTEKLHDAAKEMQRIDDYRARARFALEKTLPAMGTLRESLDQIEGRVDAKEWPFPTYQQMLFQKH